MAMSNSGGRKVYRNSTYNKKKRIKKAIGIFLTIIVIAILVFFGYSIAKPIFNYLNSENSAGEEQTEPWTPPVVTDIEENNDAEQENDEQVSETTANTSVNDEKSLLEFTAYELPADALLSAETLVSYINQAKIDGYSAVIVTMKAKGGAIYYNTASEFARTDENTVVGTLPAAQISSMIKSNGLKAFAYLNILEDNNRYGENRDGSYHTTDGSTWLDNSVANGGKPWLSPFDENTKEYTAFLANEISAAGFDVVVADGVMFPTFRNSDIGYLGDSVKSSARYKALIEIVNIAKDSTETNNASFMFELDAADIINGTCEAFKPNELADMTLIIDYVPSEFDNTIVYNGQEIVLSDMTAKQRFSQVFTIISSQAGDSIKIIPSLKHSDFNQADYSEIISEIINEGFNSYIVK